MMADVSYPIAALHVGKPADMAFQNQTIRTGINKNPIHEALYLGNENFVGDGQADRKNHGGPDKAVCVYCEPNYTYWKNEHRLAFEYGAFGENVTLGQAEESAIRVGDIYQLGEAVVQVSQPRKPCYKVGAKHKLKHLPKLMEDTGFTGFYLRVIEEGWVEPNVNMQLLESADQLSIADINDIYFHQRDDQASLRRIMDIPELATAWRKMVKTKIY